MTIAADAAAVSNRPLGAIHENAVLNMTCSYRVDSARLSPRDTHGGSETSGLAKSEPTGAKILRSDCKTGKLCDNHVLA
jgi:hypothetical protein